MIDRIFGWDILVTAVTAGIIMWLTKNIYIAIVGGLICGEIWYQSFRKKPDGD